MVLKLGLLKNKKNIKIYLKSIMSKFDFTPKKEPSFNVNKTRIDMTPVQKIANIPMNTSSTFRMYTQKDNTVFDSSFGLNLNGRLNLNSLTTEVSSRFFMTLDKAGVSSLIKEINIKVGGYVIPVTGYNVLCCMMKDYETDPSYCGNSGTLLEGMSSSACGSVLEYERNGAGVLINPEKTYLNFSVPLAHNVISNCKSNFPLSGNGAIDIEIVWEEVGKIGAFKLTSATPVNETLLNSYVTLSNIQLSYDTLQLSSNVFNALANSNDGVFKLHSTNWFHSTDIISAGERGISSTISCGASSMKRVLTSHRDSTKVMGVTNIVEGILTYPLSLGHRINTIKSYHYSVDTVHYPNIDVLKSSQMYSLLKADDVWGEASSNSSLCCDSGITENIHFSPEPFNLNMASTGVPIPGYHVGSYISAHNFEVMNHGKSHIIMDGMSLVDSDFLYVCTLDASATDDVILDHFVQGDVELILNMKTNKVFEYYS